MAKVIVIGAGKIGQKLSELLIEKGHRVLAQATRTRVAWGELNLEFQDVGVDGIIEALRPSAAEADAVMLAIPNGDKGVAELKYMSAFRGKHIITCAKAAHAFKYGEVLALGQPIGRRATVGGGTDMLEVLLRRHLGSEVVTIYTVLNGTLNYVWSIIQAGGSFAAAIDDAKSLGFAEPSNDDPVAILNGELADVCMKSAILKSVALPCDAGHLSADDINIIPLTSADIPRLTSRNARYRFIVTFSTVPDVDEIAEGTPGSIRAKCGRWNIVGGFHDVKAESPWYDWLRQIDGVNNGFTIHNSLGKDTGNSLGGPGAGPEVTAKAMIRDLHDLLAI